MAYGLRIRNNAGGVIINETWRNYSLRKSGVLTESDFKLTNFYGVTPYKSAEFVMKDFNRPLIVIRSADAPSRAAFEPYMQLSYGVRTPYGIIYTWHNLTVNRVEYFVFDDWQPPMTSKYVFRVNNAAGQPVFHSDWYPLKIVDLVTLANNQPQFNDSSVLTGPWDTSKKLGWSNQTFRKFVYNRLEMSNVYIDCHYFDTSNVLHSSWMFMCDEYSQVEDPFPGTGVPPLTAGRWPNYANFLICDVSNYPTNYSEGITGGGGVARRHICLRAVVRRKRRFPARRAGRRR
ncbi:MAG: hypothetical protein LBP58_02975 [Azoarcus sp.]|jgi:hypothetical protein|nr:hypothetical protein [Azoarcus sp.]